MSERELKAARDRIDELDREIQSRISERARIAQEIARIKQKLGGNGDHYRPAREAEVLRKVVERNEGPLPNEAIGRLMREIMSACLSLESPLTVAYLGPEGTYTQAAVYKHFGHFVTARPLTAIDEIFREVEAGNADYGVVPVENSTEGVVSHTLDLFVGSTLKVCGEVALPVHHHLLSQASSPGAVKRVYGHAQSLAQCRKWLDGKLPNVVRVAVASNAEGARLAAAEPDAAAIAGKAAAELYGLATLAANIEDEPDNTTRFLVIGRQSVPPTGCDMTSLLLSVHNRPGALHDLLTPFAEAGVNLTRIESRPSRRAKWDYNFFVDIEGHVDDARVQAVLERIQAEVPFFKVLGSYPRTVI
jgi:chorismate mutase / prephenate dehydratase